VDSMNTSNGQLPSISQTIKNLHAAVGYPIKDTWIKAIKAGHYTKWPGLTTSVARKQTPKSDKTKKRHMKRQRQGVRSARTLQTILEEDEEETIPDLYTSPVPKPKKMQDVCIKIHNASEMMHTDQPG
jgi:hypothetical protein